MVVQAGLGLGRCPSDRLAHRRTTGSLSQSRAKGRTSAEPSRTMISCSGQTGPGTTTDVPDGNSTVTSPGVQPYSRNTTPPQAVTSARSSPERDRHLSGALVPDREVPRAAARSQDQCDGPDGQTTKGDRSAVHRILHRLTGRSSVRDGRGRTACRPGLRPIGTERAQGAPVLQEHPRHLGVRCGDSAEASKPAARIARAGRRVVKPVGIRSPGAAADTTPGTSR